MSKATTYSVFVHRCGAAIWRSDQELKRFYNAWPGDGGILVGTCPRCNLALDPRFLQVALVTILADTLSPDLKQVLHQADATLIYDEQLQVWSILVVGVVLELEETVWGSSRLLQLKTGTRLSSSTKRQGPRRLTLATMRLPIETRPIEAGVAIPPFPAELKE